MQCCWGAALALLVAGELAAAAVEEQLSMAPVPFLVGSRYGRSEPRVMTARADKFFMTGRYGKRSGAPPAPPLPLLPPPPLLCDYTGLLALYRCRRANVNADSRHDRKLAEDWRSAED